MSIVPAIKSAAKRIWKAISARYEGSVQRWGERSWLPQSYQSARFDADAQTRQELQRRHRYWVCNSALVQRIRNLFIQFSCGVSGLAVIPNSSNEDWNHSRQNSWGEWCKSPDLSSELPMSQICIQWAGALFDDGEVFIYKTRDKSGKPMIQTIEAHRCFTPTDEKAKEGKTVIDGIVIDSNGRPSGYWIQDEFDIRPNPSDSIRQRMVLIPAKDIIHLRKARRPGMMRGIPEGFSGLNTLHDYEDLHMLEMQVAKMAASIGNVETNPTGEIDTTATRRVRLQTQTQNQIGQAVLKNSDQFYKVTLGAQHIALKAGDSLKQFQVDRPSIATQQYWDLLISEICCSYNVPKLLVVPYSLQGTVTRADLDICANAFRFNFELLAWGMMQVYQWQTEWAVKYDRSMDGAPPSDYIEAMIRPPRAPNVDIGYTAKSLQVEMQLGIKTIQDVYAEKQQDWRVQLRQIAESEQYIDQLASEFGIDPERISQKVIQKQGPQDGQPGQEQTDSEASIPIKIQ